MKLALFYLARKAEGLESFRQFAQSYRRYPAGCEHTLVIIYKGFDDSEMAGARAVFGGMPHREIRISDEGFDIGAYLHAAAQIDAEFVCFVNTHTHILSASWLEHLYKAILLPGAGMAGASGSYESLYSSRCLTSKAVWLTGFEQVPYNEWLASHFKFVLESHAAEWLKTKGVVGKASGGLRGALRAMKQKRILNREPERSDNTEGKWVSYWKHTCSPGEVYDFLRDYPPFPNPHIRSNGFIIRRSLLLKLFPEIAPTKTAAYAFESGPDSLSAQVRRAGYQLALVDRYGKAYGAAQWPKSKTFRLDQQNWLMMSDNQSRGFDAMAEPEKMTHVIMSWGTSVLGRRKAHALGINFEVDFNSLGSC